jgi:hypothetical protein
MGRPFWLGVMVHAYNPSTWEAKAGESQILGQPGKHSKKQNKTKPRPPGWEVP